MFWCSNCGNEFLKWQGQCSFCREWNTLKEFTEAKKWKTASSASVKELTEISETSQKEERIMTSSEELNSVLWGGIVPGSITLLSGEPGIGKSTLTLQLGAWIQEEMIYISGEETESQLLTRAKRLSVTGSHLKILSESNLENILKTLEKHPAKVVVIDSISVMYSDDISGTSGSISQVRYITEKLVEFGKSHNTAFFIIGHVTKDGSLAGPKTLEHMVDVVLYFEGDKFDNLRILRGLKNRFGTTSEVALYKMEDIGLVDLKNPGLEFVNEKHDSIGSCLSLSIEWSRPLVIETEALTTYTKFGYPKRSARGVAGSKLDLIIAVLGKYTAIKLESYDVYINLARGMNIEEPGIDLSIAASIISSKLGKALSKKSLFVGEISLTGKIKNVMHLEKRLKEAEKMGFEKIYIPDIELKESGKIKCIKLKNVEDLAKALS
jgi:DNA repair protein RadA/Sms